MVGELLHEDGIGRAVAFHELKSCRWLQLQSCIGENTVNSSVLATKEIAVSKSLAPWKQNSGLHWPAIPPAHHYKRGQPCSWHWIVIHNTVVGLKSSTVFIYQREELGHRVIKWPAPNHRPVGKVFVRRESWRCLVQPTACSYKKFAQCLLPSQALKSSKDGDFLSCKGKLVKLKTSLSHSWPFGSEFSSWTAHLKVVLLASGQEPFSHRTEPMAGAKTQRLQINLPFTILCQLALSLNNYIHTH